MKFYKLLSLSSAFIKKQKTFFLFESNKKSNNDFLSYIFFNPSRSVLVNDSRDIIKILKKISQYKKYFTVSLISYETGYYTEDGYFKLTRKRAEFPFITLYMFKKAVCFNHKTKKFFEIDADGKKTPYDSKKITAEPEQSAEKFSVKNVKFNTSKEEYASTFKKIKKEIYDGNSYQVNYTGKFKFNFNGCPFSFYEALKKKQETNYSFFGKYGKNHILSLSPELFFSVKNGQITCRPMKGTMKRGRDLKEDEELKKALASSVKNKAENTMIVDLIRNDLNRVCEPPSVLVKEKFTVEKYNTLFQMTSEIKGELKSGITFYDIVKSLFPCGSVTGAPKLKTMEIIKRLEKEERKIYCGAIGLITPFDEMIFNVPIRTIYLKGNKGEMGAGGGIVDGSVLKDEYDEVVLKSKFLTDKYDDFQLIETILYDKKYFLLNEHLKRLKNSALYFNFDIDTKKIKDALLKGARDLKKTKKYKVRLLLFKDGKFKITFNEISPEKEPVKIIISKKRVRSNDIFLYHKTTNRKLYDAEYKKCLKQGYFDAVFLNEKEEVTEGCITNIAVKVNGKFYTPPAEVGLLNGVMRAHLLRKGAIKEKIITLKDLQNAREILVLNSVRLKTRAFLKWPPEKGKNKL